MESAQERRARAATIRVTATERANTRIAHARASVEEALEATPSQRLTLDGPEVTEKLMSTAWLGRVIALQGILRLVSKTSLSMRTLNVVQWELMQEEYNLYDKLVLVEAAFQGQPKETDSRWSTIPLDPFPSSILSCLHEEQDPKNFPGMTRVKRLLLGTCMGQVLKVPKKERADGANDEFAHLEATFDPCYDVAQLLECVLHFSTFVSCETSMSL
jgi:hypothetical protein